MDHESPAVTEFIEVEINSAELTEFLEELSTINGVKTKFIGDSAVIEKANTIAVTEVEIKGEPYYEEPIFQPFKGQIISEGYCVLNFPKNQESTYLKDFCPSF
jgi:hypothetical protein